VRRLLDALNYWEWTRFGFNGILFAVIVCCTLFYPASHSYILFYFLELIWIVGVLNLIYCIVYPVDLIMQSSAREAAWRKRGRFGFWLALTVFLAVVLAIIIILATKFVPVPR
jgi:hypothetical protein